MTVKRPTNQPNALYLRWCAPIALLHLKPNRNYSCIYNSATRMCQHIYAVSVWNRPIQRRVWSCMWKNASKRTPWPIGTFVTYAILTITTTAAWKVTFWCTTFCGRVARKRCDTAVLWFWFFMVNTVVGTKLWPGGLHTN